MACGLLMVWVDRPLALFLKAHADTGLIRAAATVTDLGKAWGWLIASATIFLLARFVWRRALLTAQAGFVFTCVAVSGLTADAIKAVLGRARPKLLFLDGEYGFSFWRLGADVTSFPSGHATSAMALALSLAMVLPKFRYPLIGLGVLLAFSRVLTAAHYLSDVVAASALAAATVVLVKTAFERRGLPVAGRYAG
jgi:membrane-associated phospholipid phosphatase